MLLRSIVPPLLRVLRVFRFRKLVLLLLRRPLVMKRRLFVLMTRRKCVFRMVRFAFRRIIRLLARLRVLRRPLRRMALAIARRSRVRTRLRIRVIVTRPLRVRLRALLLKFLVLIRLLLLVLISSRPASPSWKLVRSVCWNFTRVRVLSMLMSTLVVRKARLVVRVRSKRRSEIITASKKDSNVVCSYCYICACGKTSGIVECFCSDAHCLSNYTHV